MKVYDRTNVTNRLSGGIQPNVTAPHRLSVQNDGTGRLGGIFLEAQEGMKIEMG